MKPKYDVKTYFQYKKSRQEWVAEYFFQIMYNTILPSLCLLMAVQSKSLVLVSGVFWLGFVVFSLLQIRVKFS